MNPVVQGAGSVALVTGASSGLGAGLSQALAAEGWRVGLLARRERELRGVASRIEDGGGQALVLPCDVCVQPDVASAVKRLERELGPVELLVANAGTSGSIHFDRPGFHEQVEQILTVNFLGAVYVLDAVLPGMLERGTGQVVAMGSLAGFRGLPLSAAYTASKGAMANFFESLRIDLRGSGIDVTLLRPGYISTPLTARNAHRMPWIVDQDDAIERILTAIRRRRRSFQFPWPLASAVWLGQILPDRVYDFLASHVRREKKDG